MPKAPNIRAGVASNSQTGSSFRGVSVSSPTIQNILIKHNLGSRYERLLKLEKRHLSEGISLTPEQVERIEKLEFDFVAIDTPGRIEGITRQVAGLSDFVFVPCVPSSMGDIEAMGQTCNILAETKTDFAILFNRCRGGGFAKKLRETFKESGENYNVLSALVSAWADLEWSWFEGKSLHEAVHETNPSHQGIKEIDNLYKEIKKRMSL